MYTLYSLISNFASTLRSMIGLVLPVFSNAADFRNWPTWVRIGIGFLLLGGICYGAHWLQQYLGISERLVNIPYRDLRPYYLVILVLLFVAFSWLVWVLWKLLVQEEEAAEFPDILSAWTEAVKRLETSGMKVGDAPLFLVIGAPAAGTDALLLAAGVKDIIRAPSRSDSPLRIYAWNDAIFVTGVGCSAWGALCGELTGQGETSWAGDLGDNASKTIGAGGFMAGADPIARAEMDELLRLSKERDLNVAEQARLKQLAEELTNVSTAAKKKLAMPDDVILRGTRRLKYLCKLIRMERRPWCPLNGVVALVPWDATESEESVRLSSNVLYRDLAAAREILQMRYPTYSVVCDLETARGFNEFRNGFPAEVLKQRIGQRLPLAPDVDTDKVQLLISKASEWIGLSVLPAWILRFLRLESANARGTASDGQMHNRNLYLLMRGVFDRGPRLAQVLSRGLPNIGGNDLFSSVPLFGGCYLAATGRDGQSQAFVPGVFERILSTQNSVSWTPDAVAADVRLKRLTFAGYAGILLLGAAAGLATWWMLKGKA